MPEPTGDLTQDLQTALKSLPTFTAQWSLGLIYAVITDYTLFALLVLSALVTLRHRSPILGGIFFFIAYAALRASSIHADIISRSIALNAQVAAGYVRPPSDEPVPPTA